MVTLCDPMATSTQPNTGAPLELRARALALHDAGRGVSEVAEHLGITASSIYNWRKSRDDGRGPTLPHVVLTQEDNAWLDAMSLLSGTNGANGSHIDEGQEEDNVVDVVSVETQVSPVRTDGVEDLHEQIRQLTEQLEERSEQLSHADRQLGALDESREKLLQESVNLTLQLAAALDDVDVQRRRMEIWRAAAKDALDTFNDAK